MGEWVITTLKPSAVFFNEVDSFTQHRLETDALFHHLPSYLIIQNSANQGSLDGKIPSQKFLQVSLFDLNLICERVWLMIDMLRQRIISFILDFGDLS